jgi:DNA-binding SARP family transcriptional activator/TolB-like protein/Flp pilus assembly protein TadD
MAMANSNGATYLPRTRKTRAILAVLAMSSPKPVLRQFLASLLWSRREKEQARGSLRQSVHELQDTLGADWAHVFFADRHHLSIRGPGLDIDALSLTQPATMSVETLERFDDILLEDLNGLDPAFDRWLDDERARFQRIGRTIGESLLAKCENPVVAIDVAEQLLSIDRHHQGAWRTIMRSHAERGDFVAAMTSYDRCRGVLAEAADARPSLETEDLIGLIRAQSVSGRLPIQSVPGQGLAASQAAYTPPVPRGRSNRSALRLRVAPLRTIGAERNDGLALGLAEEISAGLSRFRWISCVPASLWPSVASGGEVAMNTRDGLEADLVLDGTIQYGPGRVRINVSLIDMRTDGEIAWAGRFDRPITDALSMQDEIGAAIVAQVDPELMMHEGRRHTVAGSHDMTAQDLLLQALPAIYRTERSSFINARQLLEASLRADPASSVAHGWLAYWNLLYVGQGWAEDPIAASAEAARLAERAVMLDPGDARALTLAGHVRGFLGHHPEEASVLHDRAIALNPNLAIAWCFSGLSQVYAGRHDEALRRINQAYRLSPSDPHAFFFDNALMIVHLLRGDYASAVNVGRRAVELNPLFSSSYKVYLAALGSMDRDREAQDVLRRLLELEPGFSVQDAVLRSPLTRPDDINRYAEGLRRAGLPECGTAMHGATLAIEHSAIDLALEAPQSPILMRDGSHGIGRLRNETTE